MRGGVQPCLRMCCGDWGAGTAAKLLGAAAPLRPYAAACRRSSGRKQPFLIELAMTAKFTYSTFAVYFFLELDSVTRMCSGGLSTGG